MTAPITLITGASSGIGRALAEHLAGAGQTVIAVARRADALATLAEATPGVEVCAADVASADGQARIEAALAGRPLRWLVHNAGVLAPVGPLLEQSEEDLHHALAVNLQAPIALTRRLLKHMEEGGRILQVSSGAAHRALPGWGAYCISKAGLYMAYEVLKQELEGSGVAIASLRPGVVDTPMQGLIRAQTEHDFPAVQQFRAMKESGQLSRPEAVAQFITAVLELADTGRFSAGEWDIREHHPVR